MTSELYPCPCCGYRVYAGPPGTFSACPICYWEDDAGSLRTPRIGVGPNIPLIDAQVNFERFGAAEEGLRRHTRDPAASDEHDESWRKVRDDDVFLDEPGRDDWPEDLTLLYYWRPTYWLLDRHLGTSESGLV